MLPLDTLMLRFEALGDNCEFGLVQRRAGVEPLGLLRFAGFHIPIEQRLSRLAEALETRFEGLGRPDTVRVEAEGAEGRREYLIHESRWNLMYHSFQLEGQIVPEVLRLQEARKLEFLRRKLMTDLEAGEKILVWKSNLRVAARDIDRLSATLAEFGPNTLLWVEQADGAHPSGTVEQRGERLIKGYVERLAPYDDATAISYDPWFGVCEQAYRLSQEMTEAGQQA